MIKDGFWALKYKIVLKNCNSNCQQVHYDIVALGKKNNTLVTYKVSYPTTQTEKDITTGAYWMPDLIKYYSTQYNLEPESIVEHESRTSTAVEYLYTYLNIARFDVTIDNTIDNAFGDKTIEETILFYLISTFLVIIGRYIYFASKQTEQWIDTYSKKGDMKKVIYYYGNNEKFNYYLLSRKQGKSTLAEDFEEEPNDLIVDENGIQSNHNYILVIKDKLDNYISFIALDSKKDFEVSE